MTAAAKKPGEPTWADVCRQLKILARLQLARFLIWLVKTLKL
jgi:hypothetical protein